MSVSAYAKMSLIISALVQMSVIIRVKQCVSVGVISMSFSDCVRQCQCSCGSAWV